MIVMPCKRLSIVRGHIDSSHFYNIGKEPVKTDVRVCGFNRCWACWVNEQKCCYYFKPTYCDGKCVSDPAECTGGHVGSRSHRCGPDAVIIWCFVITWYTFVVHCRLAWLLSRVSGRFVLAGAQYCKCMPSVNSLNLWTNLSTQED